ncbi:MAG: GTPase HflX [Nitrososphaerales archaeon]
MNDSDEGAFLKETPPRKPSGEKAIVITYPDDFVKNEAIGLVEAAGYRVTEIVTTKRLSHPQYGIGTGKAEEIRRMAEEKETTMVIVDDRLSSSQAHNLAKFTHQQVIDRERLILDIFGRRATTTEAKLQVKLAELKYEIPRAREAVRLSLKGEQAGFMGMGEYAVDIKFRALKRQMVLIQKKLEQARKRRELFRVSRDRLRLPLVSLAGYTSSGKTTLFNRFVSEKKEESPNLFTTLTTTTRGFDPLPGKKVLLSDTVGFISRLPTYMVEAFKSTLEELTYADVILLMVDASEPMEDMRTKYISCRQVLEQLNINPARILVVLNKLDITKHEEIEERISILGDIPNLGISAKTGEGIKRLRVKIVERIFNEPEIVRSETPEKDGPRNVVEVVGTPPNSDKLESV